MGVPTTPHKKELKNKSLALIEYAYSSQDLDDQTLIKAGFWVAKSSHYPELVSAGSWFTPRCIVPLNRYRKSDMQSEVESHPSTAINACYQQAFQTKTEYSGLAVMGFENEFIIKQLIDDIAFFLIFCRVNKLEVVVSSIGSLDENRLYNVGTGFVSSFTTRYRGAQHLFVLKIEESLCVLEIYSEPVCVNKITGSDPDEVWNQVEFLKKYIGSYLFGITNTLVQEHLNANNKSPTCAVKEWTDIQKLEKDEILERLEKLKRHMRRDYEEELE
ncbi:6854_t:CDS:2, partial [Gigaspora rosea]